VVFEFTDIIQKLFRFARDGLVDSPAFFLIYGIAGNSNTLSHLSASLQRDGLFGTNLLAAETGDAFFMIGDR
jgi:hypothetical protein